MPYRRLSDREMFCARPWRAPDRAQVIFAVVETAQPSGASGFDLVIATLQGSALNAWPLDAPRPLASFSEAELLGFYNDAMAVAQLPRRALA